MFSREEILPYVDIPSIRTRVTIPMRVGQVVAGEFFTFHRLYDNAEHIAIAFKDWDTQLAPMVRIHSECLTGDVFDSQRCDCGAQLDEAIKYMSKNGGILLYLRQEGRGIGLYNKLDAYRLQDNGLDTYEANRELNFDDDLRSYRCAAEMLQAMSVTNVRLLSNNPRKIQELQLWGIMITSVYPTGVYANKSNWGYLNAKCTKTHHTIALEDGYEFSASSTD